MGDLDGDVPGEIFAAEDGAESAEDPSIGKKRTPLEGTIEGRCDM